MTRPALPVDRYIARCRRDPLTGCLNHGRRRDAYAKLWINGKCVGLHKVALELRVGLPLPPGLVVRHLARCAKSCVEPTHLRSGTPAENAQDSIAAGTFARGSRNGMARLTEDAVLLIREAPRTTLARAVMSIQFGVTHGTVRHVQERRVGYWQWLPEMEAS